MRISFAIAAAAVTLSLGGAPVAHADGERQAATTSLDVKKEDRLRFYGLGLEYAIYDGTSLNAVNYSNTVDQYFLPSWSFGRLFFKGTRFETMGLSARFILSRALVGYDESSFIGASDNGVPVDCSHVLPSTNGTVNVSQVQRCDYAQAHRWAQGDLSFTLSNPKIYTIPVLEINLSPSIRVGLPTSRESQFQSLNVSTVTSLGASRSFLAGKVTLGYSFGFSKNFHKCDRPCSYDAAAGTSTNYAQSPDVLNDPYFLSTISGNNTSFGFTNVFRFEVTPVEKLSLSLLYILSDSFAYPIGDTITYNGMTVDTKANGDAIAKLSGSNILSVAHRDSQWFWATIGYQITDWVGVSLALITISPQRYPSGTWRQPFLSYDYNAFTQLNIGASVSLEKAAAKLF